MEIWSHFEIFGHTGLSHLVLRASLVLVPRSKRNDGSLGCGIVQHALNGQAMCCIPLSRMCCSSLVAFPSLLKHQGWIRYSIPGVKHSNLSSSSIFLYHIASGITSTKNGFALPVQSYGSLMA